MYVICHLYCDCFVCFIVKKCSAKLCSEVKLLALSQVLIPFRMEEVSVISIARVIVQNTNTQTMSLLDNRSHKRPLLLDKVRLQLIKRMHLQVGL